MLSVLMLNVAMTSANAYPLGYRILDRDEQLNYKEAKAKTLMQCLLMLTSKKKGLMKINVKYFGKVLLMQIVSY